MTRPRITPGGTGRPRSKTSTTITVTHEHVPRWVEAAQRAGMSPPQYVASVLDGQATAWCAAWRAGYAAGLAHASEALEELRGTLPEPGPKECTRITLTACARAAPAAPATAVDASARRLGPDDAAPR